VRRGGEETDAMKDKPDLGGRSGGGDSGGGAYPNPHSGKDRKRGGFLDHGGQSEMAYHGTGRLGAEKVGDNKNAPAADSGSDETDEN
jgi:hypothetical protein